MKTTILLLAIVAVVLSSCSTAYKTGQTPDDVYYSPTRPQNENDQVQQDDKKEYTYTDEYYDDRYLRMKVRNRYRWNELNNWYYYDRFSYGYNYYYGTYNNPYNSWNYYYNPYCCCHNNTNYGNSGTKYTYNKPRTFNLNSYNSNTPNNSGYKKIKFLNGKTNQNAYTAPRNSNISENRNSGNILRNIFRTNSSGSSNNNTNSSGNNNNTSSSGNNNTNSSSSSGSNKAPVRKF